MDTVLADFRYALRKLARAPVFTAVAAVTLALGIGANTAIFSVVYGVLMRPLPFERPEDLVRHYTMIHGDRTWANTGSNYLELQRGARSFADLVMYSSMEQTLTERGEPTLLQAAATSANFFDVLGARPALGRFFDDTENEPGHTDVVVIGYSLWQNLFAGDHAAIGATLVLNGSARRVVGVAPRGFVYPDGARVWIPVEYTAAMRTEQFGQLGFHVIGRLASGATVDQARAEANAQAATVNARFPHLPHFAADVEPLLESAVGGVRAPLLVLLAAVGFVLLIACANIANLLLVRATARGGEFAVRTALGAGRYRLIQQLLLENLTLALLGGTLGVLLASWTTDALVAMSPDGLPRLDEIRVDSTVLLFSLGVSLLTGVLFSLVPVLHLLRGSAAAVLRSGTRSVAGGVNRVRSMLVVTEMALALVLLAAAGLLINSLARLTAVEPGFDADNTVAARLWLPPTDFPDWERVRLFYEQTIDATAGLPGVRAVGAVQTLPLDGTGMQLGVYAESRPPDSPDDLAVTAVRAATPGYFAAAGVRLLSGRLIAAADRADAPPVMLLSHAAARMLFGEADPIGEAVQLTMGRDGKPVRGHVVGVVADTRLSSLAEEPRPVVYLSFAQVPMRTMEVVVNAGPSATALAGAIRDEIHRFGPNLPVNVRPLHHLVAQALAQARFYTTVLGVFAAAALLLAAVGIYGVFSYMVEQRRREIGIRIALGAQRSGVIRMILGRAGRLALLGLGAGTAIALALTRFLADLLYGVGTRDPLTFGAVALMLGGVALLASYIPARAAARLDPLCALRAD